MQECQAKLIRNRTLYVYSQLSCYQSNIILDCSQSNGDFDDPDLLTSCLFWKAYAPSWNRRDTNPPTTSRLE